MILDARRAHFYLVSGLAVVLPIVFIAGLALRPNYDTVRDDGTTALFTQAGFAPANPDIDTDTDTDLNAGTAIASEVLSLNGLALTADSWRLADGTVILALHPQQDPQVADLLVYWVAGAGEPETIIPEAVLLGQLSGTARRQFDIPPALQGETGQLVFYSQGQQQIVGTCPLPASMTQ